MPSRSAATFAGGAATRRPRPRGASGRVSRKATSCAAARRSSTSAPSGAVAATPIRTGSAQDDAGPQHAERFLAVLVVGAVDDQHAVEMVELVERDPGRVLAELEADVAAVLVLPLEDGAHRALDRDPHALQRQAALAVGSRLVGLLDEHRVDEGTRPVLVGLEHEEPAEHAHLRRGEADSLRVVHQGGHALDEAAQVVVERRDLVRLQAQDRVAVLADLRERELAAGLGLDRLAVVRAVPVMAVTVVAAMVVL